MLRAQQKSKTSRRRAATAILAACLFGLVFVPFLYSEFFFEDYGASRKQIDAVVGETKVVPVSNPTRVAVGNPDIADVADATSKEIIISAKKTGETNLQIWDDFGQREIAIRVFEQDLGNLKQRLEDLFKTAGIPGATFQVGDQERKIFVLGDLPLRKKEVVTQLLGSFTDKIINLLTFSEDNPVVEIDVQILEIAKIAVDKLGINWNDSLTFTEMQTDEAGTPTQTLSRHFGSLLKAVGQSQFTRTSLIATLNMLEQDNLARTLARPKLVALSGKEAKFLVGGQVPILSDVSVASGTTTTTVEYVDYGVKLNIKPEVKETGDVVCQLEVEIKTIDTSTSLTVSTGTAVSTKTPGFKTRNASTELYLKNNQTVFLAGLISNEETNNLRQLPALGNIPILGALFRSKDFQVGDTEMVISITPRIIRYGDMRQDIRGTSSVRPGYDEEPADAYVRAVQEMILKNVSYPLEAQRANLSGTVVLSLHLLANGQLVNVVVSQSSGHTLLDGAAVFTVKRLVPYPTFPKGLTLREIWVEVPITYQLS